MLLMSFATFKRQGRIVKSVKKWRDEALRQGWLVEYDEGAGKVVVFISHTCVPSPSRRAAVRPVPPPCAHPAWLTPPLVGPAGWDREYLDPDRDLEDPYDKGAPDYQSGEKKDLKWRIVCAGVENLVKAKGLKEEDVLLWLDWQSIYQARARAC